MKFFCLILLFAGMLAGLTGCFGDDKKEIRLENERSSGIQIR